MSIEKDEERDIQNKFFNQNRLLFEMQYQKDSVLARDALTMHYGIFLAEVADQNDKPFKEFVETHVTALLEFIKKNEEMLIANNILKKRLK